MRSRTAWASLTSCRPCSRRRVPQPFGVGLGRRPRLLALGQHPLSLGLGGPPHLVDQLLPLGPPPVEDRLGVLAQLLGLGHDLPLALGAVSLGLVDDRVRLGLGVTDHPRRRLLGLGPDVAGGLPGGLEDAGRLRAKQLHQPVFVELFGELGTGLGAVGPVQLVRFAPLEAPDDLGQFVEEGTHLGRVVSLAHGGEMPAGDARRIEGRRLGRHDPRWYDPRQPRAEGRFSGRSGWWLARVSRSQPAGAAGGGSSSTLPPRSARAARASSSVSTAMTSTPPACWWAAS